MTKPRKLMVTQHFYDVWKSTHPKDDMSMFEVIPEYDTYPAYRVRLNEATQKAKAEFWRTVTPVLQPIINWLNKLLTHD